MLRFVLVFSRILIAVDFSTSEAVASKNLRTSSRMVPPLRQFPGHVHLDTAVFFSLGETISNVQHSFVIFSSENPFPYDKLLGTEQSDALTRPRDDFGLLDNQTFVHRAVRHQTFGIRRSIWLKKKGTRGINSKSAGRNKTHIQKYDEEKTPFGPFPPRGKPKR